ncbi:MAG TPA: hypothetical protein VIG25_15860 [Pyrinomonadaceae bacterium]
MAEPRSNGAKLLIVLAVLASFGFIVAAVVTFIRESSFDSHPFKIKQTVQA